MSDRSLALLEDLAIAGAQHALHVHEGIEVIREITALDIPIALEEMKNHAWGKAASPGRSELRTLRVGHHQLAQLLASGVEVVEASYVTGRSVSGIKSLLCDPAFKELITHYEGTEREREMRLSDRVASVGALASEILLERLEESPEKFTNGELRGLLELAVPKGAGSSFDVRAGGLSLAINFLPAPEEPSALREARAKTIDHEATKDEAEK